MLSLHFNMSKLPVSCIWDVFFFYTPTKSDCKIQVDKTVRDPDETFSGGKSLPASLNNITETNYMYLQ